MRIKEDEPKGIKKWQRSYCQIEEGNSITILFCVMGYVWIIIDV